MVTESPTAMMEPLITLRSCSTDKEDGEALESGDQRQQCQTADIMFM